MKQNLFLRWALIFCSIVFSSSLTADPLKALIVGGGSSHNFQRWFNLADKATLETLGVEVVYTENTAGQSETIANKDVLYLSNNKPFEDKATKDAIFKHAESGKGLLLVHPALWYNWKDWTEYNRDLVGGGSRGHDPLGEFKVEVTREDHPVMKGVPATFEITDELYYFTADPKGAAIEVLATAYSKKRNDHYPSVFVVKHSKARIICIALGHDGMAHSHVAYTTILKNALQWVAEKP